MKNLLLVVAVMFVFVAAGCQVAGPLVTGNGEQGLTAYGGGTFTSAGDFVTVAEGDAIMRDARTREKLAEMELRHRQLIEETEVAIREARVQRILEGDPHLKAMAGEFNTLLGAYTETEDAAEKERILVALRTTGLAIQSIVPWAYSNGYGFMVGYGTMTGMPMMPGMGGPIAMGGGLQRDPRRGRIVNETDGTIYVVVGDSETQIRPQDAVAMILPPGSYRYTAQRIMNTATGTIVSPTIGGDFRVDDRWEEDIHQGWELRFRSWAFPR